MLYLYYLSALICNSSTYLKINSLGNCGTPVRSLDYSCRRYALMTDSACISRHLLFQSCFSKFLLLLAIRSIWLHALSLCIILFSYESLTAINHE